MPAKLIVPTEVKFELTRTDAMFGTDGDPTTVVIRQATVGDDAKRETLFDTVTRVWEQTTDGETYGVKQRLSMAELRVLEAYLTMVDCNYLDATGEAYLFKFKKGPVRQTLDMTFEEFKTAWNMLHPIVADEISDKVRSVNISWRPQLGG